jgi:hypothetical protein
MHSYYAKEKRSKQSQSAVEAVEIAAKLEHRLATSLFIYAWFVILSPPWRAKDLLRCVVLQHSIEAL